MIQYTLRFNNDLHKSVVIYIYIYIPPWLGSPQWAKAS